MAYYNPGFLIDCACTIRILDPPEIPRELCILEDGKVW